MEVGADELAQTLKDIRTQGYSGVNLTVPHKETALKLVDHIAPLARRIGAINTIIVRTDGSLEGRNTDAYGFTQNLRAAGFAPGDRPAVVLGAGGAARAAVAALSDMGFETIRVVNRTLSRAEALAKDFPHAVPLAWSDPSAYKNAMLLVNATSLGMKGQPALNISIDTLPRDAWVNDMVYAPLVTDLLGHAKRRGHKTVDGLGMLLHQARPAFEAFFGRDPEVTGELRTYMLGQTA